MVADVGADDDEAVPFREGSAIEVGGGEVAALGLLEVDCFLA